MTKSQIRRNTLNSSQMNYSRLCEAVIGCFITYSISHQEKKLANRTQMIFFGIIFPESKCGYGKDLLIVFTINGSDDIFQFLVCWLERFWSSIHISIMQEWNEINFSPLVWCNRYICYCNGLCQSSIFWLLKCWQNCHLWFFKIRHMKHLSTSYKQISSTDFLSEWVTSSWKASHHPPPTYAITITTPRVSVNAGLWWRLKIGPRRIPEVSMLALTLGMFCTVYIHRILWSGISSVNADSDARCNYTLTFSSKVRLWRLYTAIYILVGQPTELSAY